MRKLAQSGVSVLLVTHHLPDIIPEIDRIIALKNGAIFCDGTKNEVLNDRKMTELFDIEVSVSCRNGLYRFGTADPCPKGTGL